MFDGYFKGGIGVWKLVWKLRLVCRQIQACVEPGSSAQLRPVERRLSGNSLAVLYVVRCSLCTFVFYAAIVFCTATALKL